MAKASSPGDPACSVVPVTTGGVTVGSPNYSGATSDGALVELWVAGRPNTTVTAYQADAARLLAFLAARGCTLGSATLTDVQAYVDALKGADASRGRYISSVKSLLSFAHRTGYIVFNVGAALRLPKLEDHLAQRILTEEQVFRLLQATKPGRNQTLVRFLYTSGARLTEALRVTCGHLEGRDGGFSQVTLFGKGGKTRNVLLTPDISADLAAICGQESAAPVFATRSGRRLSAREAHRIVARAAVKAEINGKVSPHWLRHAHASHALDRGCPIHLVQADLGHASIATTGRYAHARPGDGSAKYLPRW